MQPRRAQLVGDAPEIEVLERALRQVLALRDPLRPQVALDERARHAAQPSSTASAMPTGPPPTMTTWYRRSLVTLAG